LKKRANQKQEESIIPADSSTVAAPVSALLENLRAVIHESRQQALRAVDVIQVRTCWLVGCHIVEFEQGGEARAAYGKSLLAQLSARLTAEFGRGFDASNLRYMRLFYHAFPKCDALRHELSWTHYRTLLRVEEPTAREWYMNEAAAQNWNTRALERQIRRLYYERLLSSRDGDRKALRDEAAEKLASIQASPREFVRDPVLLEFLGLPGTGKLLESRLEDALLDNLQAFLLELGKGFAFVARQQRISTESKDFYLDLVFYNYLLKCFVLFDLKTGELTHQDIGQMDMYVRLYDDQRRAPDDGPTVGIILCAHKDHTVVRYSGLHDLKLALDTAQVYSQEQIDSIVELFLAGASREKLDPILDVCVATYLEQLDEDGQVDFKSKAKVFTRAYDFLGSILPYGSREWEKLSILLNLLIPKLPAPKEEDLSKGILESIDMDSYRVEKKQAIQIASADEDAEIDPMPVEGGGRKPEPELDRLSNILKAFNEQFGTLFNDSDRIFARIKDEIAPLVAKNEAFRNARENTPGAARIEHDKALAKVMLTLLKDDTQVYKQFVENEAFRRAVSDFVYSLSAA
jgi:predicted nuclease of restriction endonuclease-like (RecB) superfamily